MDFSKQLVVSFLEKIFDEPRKKRDSLIEFEFNCNSDKCRHDQDKFNLFYNINKNKFHCWKCGYRGKISDLLIKYGSTDDVEIISSVIKDLNLNDLTENKLNGNDGKTISLPEGFTPLNKCEDEEGFHYKNAIKYLEDRGVGEKEINKFKLGFTTVGKYKYRIVAPSYNKDGVLNYFDCRAFYPNIKPSYLKPDKEIVKKFDIIFNEYNVNFLCPIYLVEGIFDMFPIFNCVPMLGKKINNVLLNKIIKNKTPVVLCLDEDAISDVIKNFEILNGFGVEVFWCPIKDDLAKIHEKHGKDGIIDTLNGITRIDIQTVLKLKIIEKNIKQNSFFHFNKEDLQKEWKAKKQ
jgi:DNA primase